MRQGNSTILIDVHVLLLYAAIGVVMSSAWALVEVGRQSYIALGFFVNAFRVFRAYVTYGVAAGAIVGAVFWLFRRQMRSGRYLPRAVRALGLCVPKDGLCVSNDASAKSPRRFWPFLICLAFILLLLWVRASVVGGISHRAIFVLLPVALCWCIAFAILRAIYQRSRGVIATVALGALVFCYIGLIAFVIVGFSYIRMDAGDPWGFVGLAVLAGVVITGELRLACKSEAGPARRSIGWLRATILAVVAVGVPVGLWVGTTAVARTARRPAKPWNVVIIGLDTLRWDHADLTGSAGHDRILMPNLREWSAGGTIFNNAISQAPWTLPAFASILTGKYPHEHGAISYFGRLRKKEPTLAEVLREAGYYTGAAVSGIFVNAKHGFAQGFDEFNDDNDLGMDAVTSANVSDLGIEFLKAHSDERFFLFLHYYDPHYRYCDHEEWQFAGDCRDWVKERLGNLKRLQRQRRELTAEDIQYFDDLYQEEIAYTDREVGRFLKYVHEAGLDENTLFVVVADHGEEFMEHGWFGHTADLYDELIHVPLVIAMPGSHGQGSDRRVAVRATVPDVVETRSVFSSILDALGLASLVPDEDSPPSLLPMVRPANANTSVNAGADANANASTIATTRPAEGQGMAFSSVWVTDPSLGDERASMSALHRGRWKLIHDHVKDAKYLFDLSHDPNETTDVASQYPEEMADLIRLLGAWWKRMELYSSDIPHEGKSADELEKLKSLGYL